MWELHIDRSVFWHIYIYLYLYTYIIKSFRQITTIFQSWHFGPLEMVIWSPKRFPLQNRAFEEGESMENNLRKTWVLLRPDPPGTGAKFPPEPSGPKRPFKQWPKFLRNHYFYSGFVLFRALFSESPKTAKNASCRECYYPRSFSRGGFLYIFPFLCLV